MGQHGGCCYTSEGGRWWWGPLYGGGIDLHVMVCVDWASGWSCICELNVLLAVEGVCIGGRVDTAMELENEETVSAARQSCCVIWLRHIYNL